MALGAYAAASIAGADPIRTGFSAMRLGSIIYFIPFIFVADAGLLLQADLATIAQSLGRALLAIWLIAGGLQGYLLGYGTISRWYVRTAVIAGGAVVSLI